MFTARLTRPEADRPQVVDLTVTATASRTLHTHGMTVEELGAIAQRMRDNLAAAVLDAAPAPARIVGLDHEPLVVAARDSIDRVAAYLERGSIEPALGIVRSLLEPRPVAPLTVEWATS